MSKIIEKSRRVTVESFALSFEYCDCPGAGFGFDCDKDGNILWASMNPAAEENLNGCLTGEIDVEFTGIQDYSYSYHCGPVVECDCGRAVHCDSSWANPCNCNREYNGCGQQLAPRSQWGGEFVTQPEEDYGLY